MRLKKYYTSREVIGVTGLTADQLRWWERQKLVSPAVASHRTDAGGFTERRYTPVDLLELLVLADLRRRGFTIPELLDLIAALKEFFGVRLYEAAGDGGLVTLLTDGRDIYARTHDGRLFNILRDPTQALLVIGGEQRWKKLASRARPKKMTKVATTPKSARPATFRKPAPIDDEH
ncbi:MAG: MerR family transcriptional regulator [Vicinamibacterales bacterium]|nr:MerR family transcriptional regulator [Vicinamibacterales bacterium]